MRTLPVLLLFLGTVPGPLHAQTAPGTPVRHIRAFSIDFSVGSGKRPTQVGSTYYRGTESPLIRMSVARRVSGPGRGAILVGIEGSSLGLGLGEKLICEGAPNGTCRRGFPEAPGAGVFVAGRQFLTDWLAAGVSAGIDLTKAHRRQAAVDIAVPLFRAITLLAEARYIRWQEPRVGMHWSAPLSIGVRVQ